MRGRRAARPARRGLRGGLLLPALLAAALLAAGGARAERKPADLEIGVASFDRVGPPGASVPDVARLLADRLATRGVGRVVGPGGLEGDPEAGPDPEGLVARAREAGVQTVVTGRATRIGRRISLDLRLRSAAGGSVLSTHVAEASREEELDAAVDRLAEQIVREALAAAPAPSPPAVAARGAAGDGHGSAGPGDAEDAGFFGTGSSDEPINIRSAELEAFEQGGERRFVFRRDVRVRQGKLDLTSRQLEAFYPPGASQPARLEATGDVVLVQEGKEAHCDRATYLRTERRVLCFGDDAVLIQGEDRVRGKEIEFDLDTERLKVRGGADVRLQSSGGGDG